MLHLPTNCFLVPDPACGNYFSLYELGDEEAYGTNKVALIPYSNPMRETIQAQFYPIRQITEFENKSIPDNKSRLFLSSRTSKADYIKKVNELKNHIQLGNIYEINFCIEFFAENVEINPLSVFAQLCQITRAPYSALLKTGSQFIICGSPELYLKKDGPYISSKPIKGTIRRGKNEQEDRDLKQSLYLSVKERTENVMAVDVARNDLSRVAKKGTVQVNKLYNIETFETVHQMVSTVSCETKDGTSFDELLEATFPMASMTGAPKMKAMQLIDEFEAFKRRNYSGAMGLIDEKGDFTLSVLIRSIFYDQRSKHLSVAVGGAITYLSDPEKEYEECLLKLNAMKKALNADIA